jgi:hypothetical protein
MVLNFHKSFPFFHHWLVVWNMNFIFPYIGNNHPNWRIHIFQRGWNHQPGNFIKQFSFFPSFFHPSTCDHKNGWTFAKTRIHIPIFFLVEIMNHGKSTFFGGALYHVHIWGCNIFFWWCLTKGVRPKFVSNWTANYGTEGALHVLVQYLLHTDLHLSGWCSEISLFPRMCGMTILNDTHLTRGIEAVSLVDVISTGHRHPLT